MTDNNDLSTIASFIDMLEGDREKPENPGTTWITIWGEGIRAVEDLVEVAGSYIGRAKLAYGSSLLTEPKLLQRIVGTLNDAGIITYPGGTVLEMALRRDGFAEYLDWSRAVGFTGVEVCDGVIPMSDELRHSSISRARDAGFSVNTVVQEVVRKPVIEVESLAKRIDRAKGDLAAGAEKVHLVFQAMARGETPADIVGPAKRDHAFALVEAVGLENLVFEALSPDEQLFYLRLLGPEVNIGHVDPRHLVLLQTLREGLGYETFWSEVWQREHWS